ncbi:MAG: YafY family protein [Pseudomonadota bacterium]
MRRADRLFEIIQYLRRNGRGPVRARDLAAALEVSERTIYRDVRDLTASGVPIAGEAGVGYVLRAGFDLPPLMFKEQEIEALVLGARIVQSWADAELALAATDVIAKVEAAIPERLRSFMAETALLAPARHGARPVLFDPAELRRALRARLKVRFGYVNEAGLASERTVWPLSVAFFGQVWLLAAWCELRSDFRCFRLDRMTAFAVADDHYTRQPGRTLRDFLDVSPGWAAGSIPVERTAVTTPPSAS